MSDVLSVGLGTVAFVLFIGTALWVSANHNRPRQVSWWAATGLAGTLLTIILVANLLIG